MGTHLSIDMVSTCQFGSNFFSFPCMTPALLEESSYALHIFNEKDLLLLHMNLQKHPRPCAVFRGGEASPSSYLVKSLNLVFRLNTKCASQHYAEATVHDGKRKTLNVEQSCMENPLLKVHPLIYNSSDFNAISLHCGDALLSSSLKLRQCSHYTPLFSISTSS